MITFGKLRSMHPDIPSDHEQESVAAIASAVDQFEKRTNRLWKEREDHVELVRTTHGAARSLFLELWPVAEITKLEVRGAWHDGVSSLAGEWEELTPDEDFMLSAENEVVRIDGLNWPPLVRVTYDGGYTDDEAPEDVLHAIAIQARFIQSRYDGDKLVASSVSMEGGGTNYVSSKAHPLFDDTAKRHRRTA